MKQAIAFLLSILLGIAIFVIAALSVNMADVINTLRLISIYDLLILLGFYLLVYTISSARWGIVAKAFGSKISFPKLYVFRLAEWAGSYLTPFSRLGGEPVMAYLFKKEAKTKYRKGVSIIIINKVLDFASALALVFIGLLLLIINYWHSLTDRMIFILIVSILVLSYLIYSFYVKTLKKEGFFTTLIRPFKELIPHKTLHKSIKIVEKELSAFLKANKRKLIILGIISLIVQMLMIVEYKLIGLVLGINLSLISLLIINIFFILSFTIPTPGSIGSMEGMLAFIFGILGFGASKGFAFSLSLRAVEIIITIAGILCAYYYGVKSINKMPK